MFPRRLFANAAILSGPQFLIRGYDGEQRRPDELERITLMIYDADPPLRRGAQRRRSFKF
jgi:hypothetical protein